MNNDISFLLPTFFVLATLLAVFTVRLTFRRNIALKTPHSPIKKRRTTVHRVKSLDSIDSHLHATFHSSRSFFIFIAVLAIYAWLGYQLLSSHSSANIMLLPFYIILGIYTLGQFFVSSLVKPYIIKNKRQQNTYDYLKVAVIIPVYNEDKEAIRQGLRSLMNQTVLPDEIHVVDDGSKTDYKSIAAWLRRNGKKEGIHCTWSRQKNSGKRAAQIRAFNKVNKNEIDLIVTVDSDCELDPHAIEEGIKPFAIDKKIQSVAGIVIAKNAQHNLLARVTDLIFVSTQQLIDRSTMSMLKSVIVNSGGLAFYRTRVIQNAINNRYDDEYFRGRKVKFSDDSFLTLIALKMGRTVQQPSAIVFSDMPVKLSHHFRQQVRWGRGSFIRGLWRVRYLSLKSAGFWRQTMGWAIFSLATVILIQIFVIKPLTQHIFPHLYVIIIPLCFMMLISSRYFSVKRTDMSYFSRLFTYSLFPIALFWVALIMRPTRLYAMATCTNTGWGTRHQIEIVYKVGQDSELAAAPS